MFPACTPQEHPHPGVRLLGQVYTRTQVASYYRFWRKPNSRSAFNTTTMVLPS